MTITAQRILSLHIDSSVTGMYIFIPVLLVLGASANVGSGVARAFAANGNKFAMISRASRDRSEGDSELQIRATNPSQVPPRVYSRRSQRRLACPAWWYTLTNAYRCC